MSQWIAIRRVLLTGMYRVLFLPSITVVREGSFIILKKSQSVNVGDNYYDIVLVLTIAGPP